MSGSPTQSPQPSVHERTGHHLLDLPAEILQLIFWHMEPETFYTSIFTCKQFARAAKIKRTIFRHLENLPGERGGLEDCSTTNLMKIFRERAADYLCGAGVFANINSFAITRHDQQLESMGIRGHKVGKPVFSSTAPVQIAVADDLGIIRTFQLDGEHIRPMSELRLSSVEQYGAQHLVVLRMAFSCKAELAVLYKPVPPEPVSAPYERDRCVTVILVIYRLKVSSTEYLYSVKESDIAEIRSPPRMECVSLALAPNRSVCVGWHSRNLDASTVFWLVFRDPAELRNGANPMIRQPRILSLRDPSADSLLRAFNAQFVREGTALNFFEPHKPVHSWSTVSCDLTNPESGYRFEKNSTTVMIDGAPAAVEMGMPFRALHMTTPGTQGCAFTYLAFAISDSTRPASAFIVKAVDSVETHPCPHSFDLEEVWQLVEWEAVAFLAGWRLALNSSLGTVMALSPSGDRVASATWNHLLIWAFDCGSLWNCELDQYFPVRDFYPLDNVGRLRPTELSTEGVGVIYGLGWANETILWASTESGLVQWDMRDMSTGQKHSLSLDREPLSGAGIARRSTLMGS